MKEMYRSAKGYLSCYGSGDGALHFCWADKEGQANSIPVTRSDCRAYLKSKWAKHLRAKGWRIVKVNSQWNLVALIKRIDADHVTLEGSTYRYTLDGPKAPERDALQVIHALNVYTTPEDKRGEFEVLHWGTVHSIAHFLAYEEQLVACAG
jgi:hypothetical protein